MENEYKIGSKYPWSKREEMFHWQHSHTQYDVNEYREERQFDSDGNEITPTDEDGNPREYDDYITISERPDDVVKEDKRMQRESLLLAFDKWEKAVLRGREEDSEEVMQWYQNLLDLQSSAFYNIPDRVKYFMR